MTLEIYFGGCVAALAILAHLGLYLTERNAL